MRRKKLLLALTLVLLLALSLTSGLFVSVALADAWTQMNVDGFGNSNNTAATAMSPFSSSYGTMVGTRNTVTGCQAWQYSSGDQKWTKRTPDDGFGDNNNTEITVILNDSAGNPIYYGTRNETTGCEFWKRQGTAWKQIGGDGFGNPHNVAVASAHTNTGSMIFVGTENNVNGCEVLKISNLSAMVPTITRLVGPGGSLGYGFGNANTKAATSMELGTGGNWHLWVGTRNAVTGGEVWRWGGPNPVHWTRHASSAGGFGNSKNVEVSSLMRQTGYQNIVAGTENKTSGCGIYRTADSGADTASWSKINTYGFGNADNTAASSINCFPTGQTSKSDIFAGTYNDSTGCEMWLYQNNVWSKIGTNGFGSASNFCAYGMYVSWDSNHQQRKIRVATGGGVAGGARVWDNYGEGPPPPPNPVTWYLAEGSSAWGFSTYVTIENPNTTATTAKITYQTTEGPVSGGTVNLPAKSQTTVNPAEILGEKDFSTKVVSNEGKDIAVDRTMIWTGTGAPSPEGHSSIGVTNPAKTWYLPEGASAWGFECWLLIQNPGNTDATCDVTYMIENQAPQTKTKTVPANSRQSYNMKDDIGEQNASIKVVGSVPVIAERAMYRNSKREGHESIGTTTPAYDYYLAEGTTGWGFVTWLLIQNPSPTAANVTVTYMTSSGPKPQAPFSLPANSRKTIRVNDVLPQIDFSTKVHADKKIIAERSMFWGDPTPSTEVCHDSIGTPGAHMSYYLPDGQTSEGRETWTLVQNPNSTAVSVEITYLTPTGTRNVTFTDTVPANSRKTFNMADKLPNSRAAIKVVSKTAGKKIIVERAMYWNNRGAGTETLGAYFD